MRNPSPSLPSAGACSPGKASLLRSRPSHCRFSLRAFLFQKMENFLDADQHSVIHDGLPDLSQFVFIHSSLDDAGLDPYEFRIFCHLRRRAKDRTAFPGMRSIAQNTGIGVGKVCAVIQSLQGKNFLTVHKRPNNQSNLYLVRVPGECSPHEQGVLNTNAGVPHMNAGVPHMNERVSNEGTPIKGIVRPASPNGPPSQKKEVTKKEFLGDKEFIEQLKTNPAYKGIDIEREFGKMQAWLLTPRAKGRKLTRQFAVNWLNKVDVPIKKINKWDNL